MMHQKCAAVAIQHCPSLKRDVENGTLMIRQVLRYRVQCAIMSPEYVESETGEAVKALSCEDRAARVAGSRHGVAVMTRPLQPAMLWRERSEEHTSELQSLMSITYAVFCLK